jgi:hypothetical protein
LELGFAFRTVEKLLVDVWKLSPDGFQSLSVAKLEWKAASSFEEACAPFSDILPVEAAGPAAQIIWPVPAHLARKAKPESDSLTGEVLAKTKEMEDGLKMLRPGIKRKQTAPVKDPDDLSDLSSDGEDECAIASLEASMATGLAKLRKQAAKQKMRSQRFVRKVRQRRTKRGQSAGTTALDIEAGVAAPSSSVDGMGVSSSSCAGTGASTTAPSGGEVASSSCGEFVPAVGSASASSAGPAAVPMAKVCCMKVSGQSGPEATGRKRFIITAMGHVMAATLLTLTLAGVSGIMHADDVDTCGCQCHHGGGFEHPLPSTLHPYVPQSSARAGLLHKIVIRHGHHALIEFYACRNIRVPQGRHRVPMAGW